MNRKKAFLINYLGDREYQWGIHDAVKNKYPHLESDINLLLIQKYIVAGDNKYILSDSGKAIRKEFRKYERERHDSMKKKIIQRSLKKHWLMAFNERVKYEKQSIIPHGINAGWEYAIQIPHSVKAHIEHSKRLNLSELNNSEYYKEMFCRLDVAASIIGTPHGITKYLHEMVDEKIKCPVLEDVYMTDDAEVILEEFFLEAIKRRNLALSDEEINTIREDRHRSVVYIKEHNLGKTKKRNI